VPLPRLVETMTAAPAALLGLESGRLTPGAPADFVIVDLDRSWQVRDEDLKTRSKNSPYEHRTLTGRAIETVVAGRTVWTLG
jgi:dihydroorotase